jgi:hypothetical protein
MLYEEGMLDHIASFSTAKYWCNCCISEMQTDLE